MREPWLIPLSSRRHFHDLFLNGVGDQLRFVVDIEFAHEIKFVRLDRLHAQTENSGDLPNRVPFRQHLDHFALAWS